MDGGFLSRVACNVKPQKIGFVPVYSLDVQSDGDLERLEADLAYWDLCHVPQAGSEQFTLHCWANCPGGRGCCG